ncbi:MAG: hypothetical protein JRJ09_02595 [Deltaproteobacteria bacterium]|nr:hypothetical protein [Deltaproteobacteria bacterium]MBW2047400.1 hypothetical protein [Deltaproteobacteria bacterium]MBW2110432.1 hypothetical protein [Deltaproteobacteria bacterium]MBW2352992.1 hypothetical protein [Deltaproteobacteria bacterium]HDZ90540.1 hypothetical protein [Deltaproteobacteria bacterium]
MKKHMILFLVGRDRPGIVDDVSSLLFKAGANIEDSRMAVMGGRFSITALFSCAEGALQGIRSDLEELKAMGFETSLHQADDPSTVPARSELPLNMELTAMDHPGIVQRVVRILRRHRVNIRSMNTEVSSAPLSGAPMFALNLEAGVPVETPMAEVKEEISVLASDMNLELRFRP